MPKSKNTNPKTKKPRATKYTKLAVVCEKELAGKKKALVAAERRLAKAHKAHADLIAEVARLDMLSRSLEAVNKGLEPPQNIKYVYSYPAWVYTYPGSGYWLNGVWYGNNGTITINSPQTFYTQTTPSNFQGVNTPNLQITTSGLNGFNANGGLTTNANGTVTLTGTSSSFCNSSAPVALDNAHSFTVPEAGTYAFTVDLTTNSTQEEGGCNCASTPGAECNVCAVKEELATA